VRRTLWIVLALNALGAAIKVAVGVRTHTLTVVGAALDSGLDMLNNAIGIMLVSVAARAPDEDHPYGHEKFETVGALGVVGFLSISCFELLRRGAMTLARGNAPIQVGPLDVAAIVAALVVNVVVVTYESARGAQLTSTFLTADARHTRSDLLVTGLALVSLVLARAGWGQLDGWIAIAVALMIAGSGVQILRDSIPILVDARAIDSDRLRGVVRRIADVREVRSVRSRSTPSGQLFAEVTIVVPGTMSVDEAHHLADEVEAAIEREFGTSQVTVHVEPDQSLGVETNSA
jgi:cation diffusion facilitator family transporter